MPKGYKLVDPRPIAKEAPYTYFLPGPERMAALKPGDKIYVNFEAVPKRQKWDSERMWVVITAIDGERITGTLDSQPDDLPALKLGDTVDVLSLHVVAVAFADPGMEDKFEFEREYWERCLVDQAVIDGELKVEYLYREEPDMGPGHG